MAFTQEQYEAGKELMRRGSLSPERVAAFEELQKRGSFSEFEPAQEPSVIVEDPAQAVPATPEIAQPIAAPKTVYRDIIAEWANKSPRPTTEQTVSQLTPEEMATGLEQAQRGPDATQQPFFVASAESGKPEFRGEPGAPLEFEKPMEWKDVVSQAVSNTPKSAGQFITDLFTPILHPVDTAKALGNLGVGLAEKLIPGKQENERIVDDLSEALKERYGDYLNLQKTIAEDPVGVAGDIASLLVPGGAAAKGIGATKLSKAGEIAGKVGRAIEPISAAGKAAKAVARKAIPKDLPSELYQSAAKFSTVIPEVDRAKLAVTALDNEIMPTMRGLDKTRGKINDFNTKITGLIDSATEAGDRIPVSKLFSEFTDLKKKMSSEPITRQRQISRIAKEINSNFKKLGKKDITPKEAQTLKQAIYKETEGFYNSLKNSPAKIEAKQAVARAAKRSLETLFPEIKKLNEQEGALIALKKQLEKSASRISNRDLIGIGVPIKGGAGGAIGGPAGLAAGAAIGLLDTPQVKSKLAIVANRLKKKGVVLSDESLMNRIITGVVEPIALRQAGIIQESQER